ncbi:MAG: hypothetical protein P8P55_04250 [Flavobacteriaceae bacterium]|nr:hypothetical protein [Flavobacteriaceae bacterium]
MTLKNNKKSGFTVPKNYFETFDMDFISEQNLKQTFKKTGFKTPDTYFEQFEIRIPKTVPSITLRSLNKKTTFYISGIAASLVLLLMFSWPSENRENITAEAIENYLIYEEIQGDEFANFLTSNELDDLSPSSISASEIETYIFENASLEYLLIN